MPELNRSQFAKNENTLPKTILSLIDRHIESVEHMEILLLLFESSDRMSVSEIFRHIQSSPASIQLRLEQLHAGGLVGRDGVRHFYFDPNGGSNAEPVAALCQAYRKMRVRVIEAIYARYTKQGMNPSKPPKLARKEDA